MPPLQCKSNSCPQRRWNSWSNSTQRCIQTCTALQVGKTLPGFQHYWNARQKQVGEKTSSIPMLVAVAGWRSIPSSSIRLRVFGPCTFILIEKQFVHLSKLKHNLYEIVQIEKQFVQNWSKCCLFNAILIFTSPQHSR